MPSPYLLVAGDFVETGGMDIANLAVARFLAKQSEVHLVCYRSDPGLIANERVVPHFAKKPFGSYLLGSPFLNFEGQRWAKRLAPRAPKVLTNGGNCAAGGINWAHYVHSVPAPTKTPMRAAYSRLKSAHEEKVAFRKAKLVIANSRRTARDLAQFAGVSESKIRVVYLGVDPKKLKAPGHAERYESRKSLGLPLDRPLILFIGALGDKRKGFDCLFDAWLTLCRKPTWTANLVVIGSGASLDTWRTKAHESGMESRINFLGFRRDVASVIAACDVMVAPSRYEPYGLAVHEAICSGIPVFASSQAGIAERYPSSLAEFLIPNVENHLDLSDRISQWDTLHRATLADWSSFSTNLGVRSWDEMASEIKLLLDQ